MRFLDNVKRFFSAQKLLDAAPIFALLWLVTLLVAANYTPGTILSGWDNLHPEFDFALNLKRSIFAVWQEHQGLGLLGGMAHASDLPRQLILLGFSLLLPMEALRYAWTFLMLFTGAIGAYYLIKRIVVLSGWRAERGSHRAPAMNEVNEAVGWERSATGPAFLGASFYLFNLATVQMFYAPYEAFSTFFGFLPWLLLTSLLYFHTPSKRNLLLLIITLILSMPAWYVQTFFVVFMLTLSILLFPVILHEKAKHTRLSGKSILRHALFFVSRPLKLFGLIFLVNSFWLLPAMYFTVTSSQVNINSKINQMGTENIIAMNKEFGTLQDVALLKGFSLKSIDPNAQGDIEYMLAPWRDHLANPFVTIAGFVLFAVVLTGFVKTLKSKNPLLRGFAALFVLSFIALCIDTPPFSYINSLFRNYIPVANQIFRFPYTKFSTLASLVYALLFAIGITELHKRMRTQRIKLMVLVAPMLLLLLFTFPVFRGHLLYEKERTKIPQEYTDLYTFFNGQDPNTRIVNFPQQNFWGWTFYDWEGTAAYGGSGFLWYGIRQPILDRNFDVWSGTNENFYYEISYALYSKNQSLFERVLNKHQVSWLLVDKNVFDITSNKTLFIPELEEMIANSPNITKVQSFGKIDVYRMDLSAKPKNFVFAAKNLPVVNTYEWTHEDQAYTSLDNYISTKNPAEGEARQGRQEPTTNSYFYPFRSLSTLKLQKDKEITLKENKTDIDIIQKIPPSVVKGERTPTRTLTIPSFTEKEKIIPVYLRTQTTATGGVEIVAQIVQPEVILAGRSLTPRTGPTFQLPLPAVNETQYPLKINLNGADFSAISNSDKDIGVAFFVPQAGNVMTVSDSSKTQIAEIMISPEMLSGFQNTSQTVILNNTMEETLTVRVPKIDASSASFHPLLSQANKVQNCDEFRGKDVSGKVDGNRSFTLTSKGATACTTFFAPNLSHEKGFAVFVKSSHQKGQALRFWVENTDQKSIPLDTFLPKEKTQTVSSFVLPPMEQYGNSYAFHFYNTSIGRDQTVNHIHSIAAYPVFYNYLKSLQITSGTLERGSIVDTASMEVAHPNESLYVVSNLPTPKNPAEGEARQGRQEPTTIILSQSYHPGWKAYRMANSKWPIVNSIKYAFPFISGREIKDHVMVNNWANGWNFDNSQISTLNSQIVIVYLPQYLQYVGFGMLIFSLVLAVILRPEVDKKEEI